MTMLSITRRRRREINERRRSSRLVRSDRKEPVTRGEISRTGLRKEAISLSPDSWRAETFLEAVLFRIKV